MTRVAFIVSKQPFGSIDDGETRITRLLLAAAAESCEVEVIALSDEPAKTETPGLVEVPKPRIRPVRLALASVLHGRSLVHERFAPRSLVEAVGAVEADVIVARRLYMAQAALDAGRVAPHDRLVVLVDVLESTVMGHRGGAARSLLSVESRRTRRDELRCLEAASEAAFLSEAEMAQLGRAVAVPCRRLDLVLPAAPAPARLDHPVALFVGDRRWAPNAEALGRLMDLWPSIAALVPGARLRIVGTASRGETLSHRADVETLGHVDDLDLVWQSASLLLAPVATGGGVRVKVLDAARHGVPVVGSPAAIGSLGAYLPLDGQPLGETFTDEAIALLSDRGRRKEVGAALFAANRALHQSGFVEAQLASLLRESEARPALAGVDRR